MELWVNDSSQALSSPVVGAHPSVSSAPYLNDNHYDLLLAVFLTIVTSMISFIVPKCLVLGIFWIGKRPKCKY